MRTKCSVIPWHYLKGKGQIHLLSKVSCLFAVSFPRRQNAEFFSFCAFTFLSVNWLLCFIFSFLLKEKNSSLCMASFMKKVAYFRKKPLSMIKLFDCFQR